MLKIKGFIIIVALFITLSCCHNLSDLPLSNIESSTQVKTTLLPPPDTVVEFADSTIEQAIRGLLEKPDGDITKAELLEIIVLGDAEGNGGSFGDIDGKITTLSDLKWLKNLKVLIPGNCGIKNLEGIGELKHLETLYLRRNDISDLKPLLNLVKLKELDFSENPINDTTALYNLVNIESLGLGNC